MDRAATERVVIGAEAVRNLYLSDTGIDDFNRAAEITRALVNLQEYYSRELLQDSARYHRMVDRVSVTVEYASKISTHTNYSQFWPTATPFLAWVNFAGAGINFQPTTTVHAAIPSTLPRPDVPIDSLLGLAQNLYSYALWREASGIHFPVWEYEFTWNSGGITDFAPWVSGMSQGLALELFAEVYRRTSDPVWLERGYDVLNSMLVNWNEGGVLDPDTSHGYWWEEFNPAVHVWNGSVQALIGVGYFAQVSGDTAVWRIFYRGIDAVKFFAPEYDTGTWTLYSLTQGYNSVFYHRYEVAELYVLYDMTGDTFFKTLADRWSSYTPPPGVH